MAIVTSYDALHPVFMPRLVKLLSFLDAEHREGRMPYQFAVFETYRGPERQSDLFRRKKTKARAWQSAHQFGLAADIVPINGAGQFYWPEVGALEWKALHESVQEISGLIADISWDPAHVYAKEWHTIRAAL